MKIGVVVDNDLDDDKRVLREIEILKEAGYEIFVLCYRFERKLYKTPEDVKITRIRMNRRIKDILFFFLNSFPVYEWLWSIKIKKFILDNRISILHVHDLYMTKAGWSGIKRSGAGIPMILDLHENYSYAVTTYNWTKGFLRNLISQPNKWKRKEKELLSYPSKIVVLSDEFRDHLINEYRFLSPGQFCVLPNVPDLKQLEIFSNKVRKTPSEKKRPVILYFGVVAERRGIFDAISSFSNIIDKGYDAEFHVIGPIDKKDRTRFFEMISGHEIIEKIKYIAWIDLSDLPGYLELSDICLAPFQKNPQHESGVANKIYDYMCGRKPVIASDCLPQRRLIERYNCGIVYRTQPEFINAIIKLLSDKELSKRLGENGYKAVLSDLNMERMKQGLINAYTSLLIN